MFDDAVLVLEEIVPEVNYAPKGNEDGHVVQNLHFQMQFSKGGANAGEAWAMDVSERDRLSITRL